MQELTLFGGALPLATPTDGAAPLAPPLVAAAIGTGTASFALVFSQAQATMPAPATASGATVVDAVLPSVPFAMPVARVTPDVQALPHDAPLALEPADLVSAALAPETPAAVAMAPETAEPAEVAMEPEIAETVDVAPTPRAPTDPTAPAVPTELTVDTPAPMPLAMTSAAPVRVAAPAPPETEQTVRAHGTAATHEPVRPAPGERVEVRALELAHPELRIRVERMISESTEGGTLQQASARPEPGAVAHRETGAAPLRSPQGPVAVTDDSAVTHTFRIRATRSPAAAPRRDDAPVPLRSDVHSPAFPLRARVGATRLRPATPAGEPERAIHIPFRDERAAVRRALGAETGSPATLSDAASAMAAATPAGVAAADAMPLAPTPSLSGDAGASVSRGGAERLADGVPMTTADRVDRIASLDDAVRQRPLHSLTLRVEDASGADHRIRVDLRGAAVAADIAVREGAAILPLAERLPELARALGERGYEAGALQVRAMSADAAAPVASRPSSGDAPHRDAQHHQQQQQQSHQQQQGDARRFRPSRDRSGASR